MAVNRFVQQGVFDPRDIETMSMALDDVCRALGLADGHAARAVMAMRIIELVRRGEHSPTALRDRVLSEANGLASPAAAKNETSPQRALG